MASRDEHQPVANLRNPQEEANSRGGDPSSNSVTQGSTTSSPPESPPTVNPDLTASGVRQRLVTNTGTAPAPPAAVLQGNAQQQPRPGETPQERRRRRLQRDREQLLSLINSNPLTCLCILVAVSFVIVGFGYFLYELHLAYKYSSIIHKLHISSLKDGYGAPSYSSSQKPSTTMKPKPSSPNSPSNPSATGTLKPPPMLDAETEMYAKQLQTVLSSLKRTIDRIDPTTNSTTLIAGLVELKPIGSKEDVNKSPPFTTEINSEDEKVGTPSQRTSPNEDLYTFLTKGFGKDAKRIPDAKLDNHESTKSTSSSGGQADSKQSFPDYLRDLKTSLEAETKKAEEKLNSWIEKHRHEYSTEEEWNEALALKKAQEDDYNRFLDTMLYVAEELEQDYSESGMGAIENNNDDEFFSLSSLLKALSKGAAKSQEDDDDDDDSKDKDYEYSSHLVPDIYGLHEKKPQEEKQPSESGDKKPKQSTSDSDWMNDIWGDDDDEDDDDDYDDSEKLIQKRRVHPQFG